MQSDAEVFGLKGKKRTLKPGESGSEFDDYAFEPEGPNDAVEKQPQPFNETAPAPTSQTKPASAPVTQTTQASITDTPTTPTAAPSSNVGHDGTYKGMTREQYRDKWMSSGVNSVAGMKAWLAENGGEWLADNGTVMTPYGEQLDMGGNARGSAAGNGALRPAWGGGPDTPSGPSDPIAELVAAQSVGAPSAATSPTTGAPFGANAANPATLEALMSGGIDADPATAAFRRTMTRDTDRQRAQLAEQAAQDGTNASGGNDGRIRQLEEGRDEAIAGFAGNRAADVQKLQIAQDQFLKGLGFNYAQLDQNQKQFLKNLGQNKEQFLASLGLSYAQLSAQQKRDLDQLGYQYDNLEYQQNRDATLTALGGS